MRSEKDRDLERLIPVGTLALEINGSKSSSESPSASSSLSHPSGKEVTLSRIQNLDVVNFELSE